MPKSEDRVLIHFIKEQPTGLRFPRHRDDWPLHITLASWFEIDDVNGLTESLEQKAAILRPFKARVGSVAMFGPSQNVPVNVIANPEPVRELRDVLVSSVHESGGVFDVARWFDNYTPHITQHDDASSNEGDIVSIDDFHMVRLLPGNVCQVVAQFLLENGHETAT